MASSRANVANLAAALTRWDVRLRDYLESEWLEAERSIEEYQGLYIADETVESLLQSPVANGDGTVSGRSVSDTAEDHPPETRRDENTTSAEQPLTAGGVDDSGLSDVADRFDLEDRERDILLAALAPDLDGKYSTIYAYLQDDVGATRPTVEFVLSVLCRSRRDRLAARSLFAPGAPLRAEALIHLQPTDAPRSDQSISAAEGVLDYLLGNEDLPQGLEGVATVQRPRMFLSDLDVDPAVATELERVGKQMTDVDSDPAMTLISGPEGVGKRTAVAALAAIDGRPLLSIPARALLDTDETALFSRIRRTIRLRNALLCVHEIPLGDEPTTAGSFHDLLGWLDSLQTHVFVTSREHFGMSRLPTLTEHTLRSVALPVPSYALRRELWTRVPNLPPTLDPSTLAATFRLTPGQIADAVRVARDWSDGTELTVTCLYRACRAQSAGTLSAHAQRISPQFTWADIVLPTDCHQQLREVAARIKHQGTVYDEWGFEEKYALGNGLNALFAGPSGTGKTMAAEVIAADAGLALYKIDLSQVVSKYIGETERNLGRVFDEAADTDAILLFDEADALFGKRSDVSDAHDRYANIEVNYLLQRIEEHDGSVILTTNFKQNIDDAFLRRLHTSVEFPRPDEPARAAIWAGIFPERTPVGNVDVDFLSSLDLTGGNIKNVALTAAFMAADDDGTVEMSHLVRALQREYQKIGQFIRPDEFGRYQSLLK